MTLRVTGVKDGYPGLRWHLELRAGSRRTTVTADTTGGGRVLDLQTADGMFGTAGNLQVDERVQEAILDELAHRNVRQQLRSIGRRRAPRRVIDLPRVA